MCSLFLNKGSRESARGTVGIGSYGGLKLRGDGKMAAAALRARANQYSLSLCQLSINRVKICSEPKQQQREIHYTSIKIRTAFPLLTDLLRLLARQRRPPPSGRMFALLTPEVQGDYQTSEQSRPRECYSNRGGVTDVTVIRADSCAHNASPTRTALRTQQVGVGHVVFQLSSQTKPEA